MERARELPQVREHALAVQEIGELYVGQALPVIHGQLAKTAVGLAGVQNRAVTGNGPEPVARGTGQGSFHERCARKEIEGGQGQ